MHCQRIERALAQAGQQLDRLLGRDRSMELATVDLDATQIEVYGRQKQGAARNRQGQLSYAPHIAFWGQTGRALTAELVGGNREKLSGAECARIARRAKSLLPTDHGPLCFRIDSAYYQIELLNSLRAERACFTVSVPRNQAMWKTLSQIPEDAWQDALDMPGSQVAADHLHARRLEARTAATDHPPQHVHRRRDRQAQGLATAQDNPPPTTAARARRSA